MTSALVLLALLQQQPVVRPSVADTSPFRPLELPTPNGFRSASGMPGPQYWQQKVDYDIRVSLDEATHRLTGEETIRYTNNSPDTLRYLWVQLDQNAGSDSTRFSVLNNPLVRREPGFTQGATVTRVSAVRTPRRTLTPLVHRINSTMMRVDLDRPLPPRGVASIEIAWHHQVPAQGRTGRTRFPEGWLYHVAQWFPRLAVYDDVRGWNADQYIGAEFYLEFGDYDVAITAPARYTVTATGLLSNPAEVLPPVIRQRLAAASRADTIVRIIRADEVGTAALVPAGAGETRTWRFHADNVRDFAWAAGPNFLWDGTSWDGILMQALYPPTVQRMWATGADMVRHSIMSHSKTWRYPWPTAIAVNGPVGGMEYPMITFDDADDEKELYYTIDHELAHQWFPMIVASQERLSPWMDEGFATFIQYFAFRDRYPADTTRIQTLEFGSMRAYQGFLAQYRGVETPMTESQDRSPQGPMSGWNAYGKAPAGLHFLRNEVVDSAAFDAAFREYVRRWAFRHPTPADFIRSMNDGLGEDLSWFWRSWIYRTDHLDQAIDSVRVMENQGRSFATLFLSNKREMVAPVDLTVSFQDGTTRHLKLPVETWLRGMVVRFPVIGTAGNPPVRVEIDRRQAYPDTDRGNNVWTSQRTVP